MMNRYLFYFAVVTLLIVFDASTLVKIWGIIAAVLVVSAWRMMQLETISKEAGIDWKGYE